MDSIVPELRAFGEQPEESQDIAALVRGCVQGLRPGLASARRFDSRVTTVLNAIRASDDLRMSLDKGADMACLSPTRFAHLFKDQIGLPFSRYGGHRLHLHCAGSDTPTVVLESGLGETGAYWGWIATALAPQSNRVLAVITGHRHELIQNAELLFLQAASIPLPNGLQQILCGFPR